METFPVLTPGRPDEYAKSTQDWCLEQVLSKKMTICAAGRAKGVPESTIRYWIRRLKKNALSVTAEQGSAQSEEAPDSSTNDSSTSPALGGEVRDKSEDRNEAH